MQVGSLKKPSSFPLVPVGKAAAATVIMGMIVAVLPVVQAIAVPFLALPLAYVVARWGVSKGAVVAAVSAALVYIGAGVPTAVLLLLLITGVGMVLGLALQRGWRFERSFALTAGGALVALVVWGVVMWLALGADAAWLRETVYGSIDDAAAQYVHLGISTSTAETVASQMRQIVDVIPYLIPGLLGMGAILLAACSLGLAYAFFPRVREKVAVLYSLSGFRMHWATAYASIAGLAMLLFAASDTVWSTVVMYVGINVLLVSQTLFFVQGLAVARWFVINRQMQKGSRAALYIAAVLGQVLLQLTGLVGLFDTWVDYRKRYALKNPGAGPSR